MPPPVIDAHQVKPGQNGAGDFTYTILLGTAPLPDPNGDRRTSPRRRTRLRSGKIVLPNGRFLTECLVYDLSTTGARLRHAATIVLPVELQLYDDQAGTIRHAVVHWRKPTETGLRFIPKPLTKLSHLAAAEMRRKFYAMPR